MQAVDTVNLIDKANPPVIEYCGGMKHRIILPAGVP